jgi:branched-chain amino acid transport system permease protein
LIATLALRWLADALAVKGGEYAFLIMGFLLLVTMLFFPEGIIMSLARSYRRWGRKAHGMTRARS